MVLIRPVKPLLGQKVTLRLWRPEEAEWYVSARDNEVFRFTREHRGLTVELARQQIEECLAEPTWIGFAIVENSSGLLAGNIALSPLDAEDHEAEVMYWLGAAARGKGLASDAVRALVDWALQALPIANVQLLTDPDNEPSKRVAMACGFEPRGMSDGRNLFVRDRPGDVED